MTEKSVVGGAVEVGAIAMLRLLAEALRRNGIASVTPDDLEDMAAKFETAADSVVRALLAESLGTPETHGS